MAKIAALGAYFYQSLLAFGLLIVVSNLLPASDYAAYSLFVSIVQFADIVCFQWIRAASSRFYPGPIEANETVERGVIVSVNTSSNFRLRSGIAPVADFLKAGTRFGIGLDAQPLDDDDDILREMRLVWLNHRGFGLDDVLTTARLFEGATIDGRRAVIGEDGGGRIAPGAPADILELDYAAMTPDVLAEDADPTNVLLTRATRKHIRRLIVGGRVIVADGRCVTVDRPALEAELIAEARRSWSAAPPDDAATAAMKRAVRRYYGCGCHFGAGLR